MILTNKDLRVIKYDKQFKVIEDSTCRQHVNQDSKTHYTKIELNQQADKSRDLQAVTYDRKHTLAGKPIGQGSIANVYRLTNQDTITAVMSNKRYGQDSIEVIMAREIEWIKNQERKYQAWKDEAE